MYILANFVLLCTVLVGGYRSKKNAFAKRTYKKMSEYYLTCNLPGIISDPGAR